MVAGDKRRSAENLQIKSLDYFKGLCLKAENSRDQCLVALLFLSGRRISEILELRKTDLVFSDEFLTFKTFNLKSFRTQPNREFKLLRDERYYSEISIDISRSTEAYMELGPFIEKYLSTLKPEDYIFQRFRGEGHILSGMAYRIVRKLDPSIWLHWFRHQRFTNVYYIIRDNVSEPAEVIMDLHDFTKHRRLETTVNYIHRLRSQEIRRKI